MDSLGIFYLNTSGHLLIEGRCLLNIWEKQSVFLHHRRIQRNCSVLCLHIMLREKKLNDLVPDEYGPYYLTQMQQNEQIFSNIKYRTIVGRIKFIVG